MNFKLRLIALLLLVMIIFTSCSLDSITKYIPWLDDNAETTTTTTTTTKKPTTTKPTTTKTSAEDVPEFDVTDNSLSKSELEARYTLTQEEVEAAKTLLDTMVETSKTAETVDEVNALYDEFETAFYHIAQQMTISMIVYYYNMSDEAASERYLGTTDMFYEIQDKYNQSCRTMYLESPHSEELFADWSEEDIQSLLDYDSETVELKKEIDELQVQYDQLLSSDPEYDYKCVEIYKKLIIKNNALAKLYGYDNYYDYASVNVYGRDYEKEDLVKFRSYVIEYVLPEFDDVYSDYAAYAGWDSQTKKGRVDEFLNEGFYLSSKRNYVIQYLDSLEGSMGESMRHVFENKNCLFSYSGNSHPTAFQTYLYEDETPFCFFGSSGQDARTVIHEIGHYYAGLKNPDIDNYDLCETHSQGNEFLFLTYCKDILNEDVYEVVRAYQLVNACYIMTMATIIDEFEQKVYDLSDVEISTMDSDDFDAIMDTVCEAYGGTSSISVSMANPYAYWRLVCISNPVYYISYAVSASAAVNILALAEEDYDAALVAYTTLVEGVTYEDGFLGALEKAGLTTPFEEETFVNVREVLTK